MEYLKNNILDVYFSSSVICTKQFLFDRNL